MRRVTILLCSLLAVAACSSDDGETFATATSEPAMSATDGPPDNETDTATDTGTATATDIDETGTDETDTDTDTDDDTGTDDGTGTDEIETEEGEGADDADADPSVAPLTVSETGVPGLDSDDAFCAAWSRFGGTWQVILVGSTFLDDADRVARWEVSSAALVLDAYDELMSNLPAALEPERDALADGYFGAFRRRAEAAATALSTSGATPADTDALATSWIDALAQRDPSTADVPFVPPSTLAGLVDAGAAELRSRRTAFHLDPSLVVTVETPLTDEFIESTCPDQGTLAGGEVGG